MSLSEQSCIPCRGGVPPLDAAAIAPLAAQVPRWQVVDGHHLKRSFAFDDFVGALAFVNEVGRVAEAEGHHPEIAFGWGHATVTIWTHKIDGLTESDFVLAAKIDGLLA